jgi:hypothetical protein
MSSVPDCAWVRSYVLNSLEDGPVRVADLIRFGEADSDFLVEKYGQRVSTSRSSHRIGMANCIGYDLQTCSPFGGLASRCPPT